MASNISSIVKLVNVRLAGKKYPFSVTHIITTKCNFRCSYCGMWKHDEPEMTTEQIFKMLDEFSEMGMRRYGISGGEPLLRKDIGEIVSYAKKKKSIVTLFTNGVMLKEKIDQLKDLDVLIMSLDGPKEVHDVNRMPGAYNAVMKAIDIAKEHNLPVWVGTTLTKNNVDKMEELLELAKQKGFKVLIQPIYYYEGYSVSQDKISEMSDFGEKYLSTVELLIKKKKEGYPLLNSLTYLKHMKQPHDQRPNQPCWASKTYCAITPGGKVSPCYKIYNQQNWPSGVELGFKKAFLSLPPKINCTGCYSYATTEQNMFYSFYPEVIYNMYSKMIREESK